MGTSVSLRSPAGSRAWAVVRALIRHGSSPPEVLAAMMVAAASEDWLAMLQSPGLTAYAARAAEAWHEMPERLGRDDPHTVVRAMVQQARDVALAAGGGGVAVGLAERALARVLLERLATAGAPAGRQEADLVRAWRANRGLNPGDLAGSLLVETMRQVARHFFTRDGAAVTGTAAIPDVNTLRALTREVGEAAARSAQPGRAMLMERGAQAWADGVRLAFRVGGTRPPPGGPVSDGR
jgi:hypothetical protein